MMGAGVEPGLLSVMEEGEEGFVPDALGTLDLSFSSGRFSRDSASESVSSLLLEKLRGEAPLRHRDFPLLHPFRNPLCLPIS